MLVADRYRLDELLARGGMGEVWRGVDAGLHRPVAVKLLTSADDPTLIERFHLEARAAARLNHPNLVSAYDFGAHQGRPFLVMELVEGRSLAEELTTRGPLEPGRATDIAAQAARGLAAAHRQAVVHRDIKPSNLMLASDGTVKIADFGIARLIDEMSPALTATGHVMGSSPYLAPERILGSPASPASDIYALGCVMYEMLTSRPPFRGSTPTDTARQHVEATPTPPEHLRPDIPADLAELVLHALAKTPEGRPAADQLADLLTTPDGHGHPVSGVAPEAPTTAVPVVEYPFHPAPADGYPPDPAPTAVLPVITASGPPGQSAPSAPAPPGTPPLPPPPSPLASPHRRPGRTLLIAAFGLLAFIVALVVATTGSSGGSSPSPSPGTQAPAATSTGPAAATPTTQDATTQDPTTPPPPGRPHHGHGKKGGSDG